MDRYKVLKRIGVGTYGSAYLVTLKADPNKAFVLKKVKVDDGGEKERMQAEKEAAVLMQLDHPLVLSYVDHFMYKGHLCIVTNYCDGGDLCELLRGRKAPLPEPQILDLLAQILLALQYVHSKNILHRDLKTANIFLTKEGAIKLGDFGISRSLESSLDLASTIIGTPYYMSPEVMSSQPYDFKSDMWSLGCCLYEMMTLKHAFDATDLTSLVLKVMRGEHLPIPDHFSSGLRDMAKQLLSKAPKSRPSTEQCLKAPLLKDVAARAKEKVAWLEQQQRGSRSVGHRALQPSTQACDDGQIDLELHQAKERLRRIQAEREALREQVSPPYKAAAGSGAAPVVTHMLGGPSAGRGLLNQGRRVSLGTEGLGPSGSGAEAPHGAPAAVGGHHRSRADGSSGGGAGGRQVRMVADNAGGGGGSGLVAGVSGNSGQLQTFARRRTHDGDLHSTPSQGAVDDWMMQNPDPKARKEARRQQEIAKREAELLEARKAYFEERRTAEAKKVQLYQASSVTSGTTGTRSNPVKYADEDSSRRRGNSGSSRDASAKLAKLRVEDNSDSEDAHVACRPAGSSADPAAALQEFESELQEPPVQGAGVLLKNYSSPGAGLADRAAALRSYCVAALGQPLFELIYAALRRRVGGVVPVDDGVFRKELQNRLGPSRMQYIGLIDQLIFFEVEIAGAIM